MYHPIFPTSCSIPSIYSHSAVQIYISLIPSLSCFNRSVIVIDPCRSLYILFLPECLHILLVHCNPFLMSFNLKVFRNVPCSSFLTECFQLCSSLLYSVFQFVQPLKVRGFTQLSKKQLSFYRLSSFSVVSHP